MPSRIIDLLLLSLPLPLLPVSEASTFFFFFLVHKNHASIPRPCIYEVQATCGLELRLARRSSATLVCVRLKPQNPNNRVV